MGSNHRNSDFGAHDRLSSVLSEEPLVSGVTMVVGDKGDECVYIYSMYMTKYNLAGPSILQSLACFFRELGIFVIKCTTRDNLRVALFKKSKKTTKKDGCIYKKGHSQI